MKDFSETGGQLQQSGFVGKKISMEDVLDKVIIVMDYKIGPSKYQDKGNGKCLHLQIEIDSETKLTFSGSGNLMKTIETIPKSNFPFRTIIRKDKNTKAFSFNSAKQNQNE